MIYSGYPKIEGATHGALHINKPVSHDVLVAATEGLIRRAEHRLGLRSAAQCPRQAALGRRGTVSTTAQAHCDDSLH